MAPRDIAPARLLIRHFLRRLLDNDLISPHTDRHESLAVLLAMVVSLAVFVTFYVSVPYLAAFVQLPGLTALDALPDRFLFIAGSMAVSALASLMVWDALGLEARDAAILGPLPIPARTITHAKLAAALLFGAAFAVALNAAPSLLYPLFLTFNLPGITSLGVLQLSASQAATVVLAGLVGFFGVLAVHGLARLGLRESGFRRASSAAQSVLVIGSVAAVILAPTIAGGTVQRWASGTVAPPWPTAPALWYLGLNEAMAGHVLVNTPFVMPRRLPMPRALRQEDEEARTAYRALRASFADLAQTGRLAFPLVALLAVATFLWNNRRLPERPEGPPGWARARRVVRALGERLTRGTPEEARAGFFFTLQTLTRSEPHRLVLAVSVAAAATLPVVVLVREGSLGPGSIASRPVGFFAIQTMVLSALIAGFRYAVLVPAELSANWSLRMAWLGDERAYLAGARRAATLLLIVAPLLLLLPLHIALFGPGMALLHTLFGWLFAVTALDAVFLGYRKLPFACTYVPPENPKVILVSGGAAFLLVTSGLGSIERLAMQTPAGTMAFGMTLTGLAVAIRLVDRSQRREPCVVDFDEQPAPHTQRLGLFDCMAGHE